MVKMTHSGAIFSEEDRIELAKAKILNQLENTYGYNPEQWITVLKRAEKRINACKHGSSSDSEGGLHLQRYLTAIQRLLAKLEKGDH